MPYHSSFFPKSGSPNTPCVQCEMFGHLGEACRETRKGRTRRDLLEVFTRERAEAAHVLAEWTEVHNTPPAPVAHDAEMQDVGPGVLYFEDLEKMLQRDIDAFKEGHDTSMASLVTIVLGLKGTVDKLAAQNEELLARLKRIEIKASPSLFSQATATRYMWHAAPQTDNRTPLPVLPVPTTTATATQATQTETPTPAAPPAADKSKRKRSGPPSPTQQPTKVAREVSPPPSLMHSKHAGPSDALVVRPTPGKRDTPDPTPPQ